MRELINNIKLFFTTVILCTFGIFLYIYWTVLKISFGVAIIFMLVKLSNKVDKDPP